MTKIVVLLVFIYTSVFANFFIMDRGRIVEIINEPSKDTEVVGSDGKVLKKHKNLIDAKKEQKQYLLESNKTSQSKISTNTNNLSEQVKTTKDKPTKVTEAKIETIKPKVTSKKVQTSNKIKISKLDSKKVTIKNKTKIVKKIHKKIQSNSKNIKNKKAKVKIATNRKYLKKVKKVAYKKVIKTKKSHKKIVKNQKAKKKVKKRYTNFKSYKKSHPKAKKIKDLIVIRTSKRLLEFYKNGRWYKNYKIAVGKAGWRKYGTFWVRKKAKWPKWVPTKRIRKENPNLPDIIYGGPKNPLGARALYLGYSKLRIHGTNNPKSIGKAVSHGCFRMRNKDIIELYKMVKIGTPVYVKR